MNVSAVMKHNAFQNLPLFYGKSIKFYFSFLLNFIFSSCSRQSTFYEVQFSSVAQLCLTLCDPVDCSTLGFPVHHQLPKPTQTHVLMAVMPSNHLILCPPLLLLPSIFPRIRFFSNESVLHIRGQSIGASASASVLPKNSWDWFPLRLTGLISLLFKGLSRISSNLCLWMFRGG